ncbi:tRNA (adenosine(37)-N6)-threonylcarbamoyltransferase complex ATPase subunit type 1 TsaE [Geoalkalibacter halelectricus]|uniref:tRNA threonylcarbamoyladenosine biosynthesis protein TsaE n=1 Tax=Geoalkalibacter halelectricus TaxID=2847045 RepID=A0ABY5ZJX2_9BACT|nr:tRNA (adenosine(37)-N6)-threonylcarbamoyltransferase complex ATPase subunit type 1 TsaE [Geoalkalibacter halelectricus]MDO3379131.1 tRNA (adenosine(37)-N6)-threonylcarbamoyltransferase complex ATPase subunit type 1 TsaE [Geoalkalibacter halelectricus]UWZ79016.1 tRNA (adenosine(37)-N6)-threonylcarbamoyltransferase complex ATPase subunit type 1 TsaE [Geoalkalibacter halelectricus]
MSTSGPYAVETDSPEQTRAFGRLLGDLVHAPLLIWLSGELGAGKTCLTQGLAQGLDVPAEEAVTSPSYTLMNQYQGRLPLYHFDLYRLSSPDQLEDLDFSTYLESEGVTVVEWADRFAVQIEGGLALRLQVLDDQRRRIELHPADPHQTSLVEQLLARWAEEVIP